jgi:hypothetical protein
MKYYKRKRRLYGTTASGSLVVENEIRYLRTEHKNIFSLNEQTLQWVIKWSADKSILKQCTIVKKAEVTTHILEQTMKKHLICS